MEEVITMADAAYHATTAAVVIPSSSAPVLPYAVISVPCVCDCSIPQGGMPSSHSSTVVALAVSIGLHDGVESSSFAMAVVMAFIVMYDASGVRLHASRQAEVLNQIVCEFPPEHPLSTSRPLRDSLGHTPLQVIAGAMLGFIVALMMKASE